MDMFWIWIVFFMGLLIGFMFIFIIVYIKWSGPYGWVVFKARLSGARVSWFIDNHGEVHPEAVSGEFGYSAADAGIFLPDPDNPVKTDQGKHLGGLYDTNMAPAVNFNLLMAVKKLTKLNIRGYSQKNGGIEHSIADADAVAMLEGENLGEQILEDLTTEADNADDLVILAREDALEKLTEAKNEFIQNIESIDDENIKNRMFEAFDEIYQSILQEFEEKTGDDKITAILEPVVEKYKSKIDKLKAEFSNILFLSDPEIKALRMYYNLNQPQYVEKKVQASVNEAINREKSWIKTFMVVAGFVIVVVAIVVFGIYITGEPTVIIQGAAEAANNSTTLPM